MWVCVGRGRGAQEVEGRGGGGGGGPGRAPRGERPALSLRPPAGAVGRAPAPPLCLPPSMHSSASGRGIRPSPPRAHPPGGCRGDTGSRTRGPSKCAGAERGRQPAFFFGRAPSFPSPFSASSLASTASTSRSHDGPDAISAVAAAGCTADRRATAAATDLGLAVSACGAGGAGPARRPAVARSGGAVREHPPGDRADVVCIARGARAVEWGAATGVSPCFCGRGRKKKRVGEEADGRHCGERSGLLRREGAPPFLSLHRPHAAPPFRPFFATFPSTPPSTQWRSPAWRRWRPPPSGCT